MKMRTNIWLGVCASFAAAAVLGLSAQQPATSPNGTSTSSSANMNKSITVTGCIERAPASAVGTSGSTGATAPNAASANDTKFVLDKASASSSASSIPSSYRLDSDEAKLMPHVGHEVEVTGTVDEQPAGSATSAGSANMSPRLKVDMVKMLAEHCN